LIGGASTASAAAAYAWNGTGGGREAVPEAISPASPADHHRHALPRTPLAGSRSARRPAGITIEVPQDAGAFGAGSDDGTLDNENEDDDARHLHQLLLRATRSPYCPSPSLAPGVDGGEGGGDDDEENRATSGDKPYPPAGAAVPGTRFDVASSPPGGGTPCGITTVAEAGKEEEEEVPPGTAPVASIDFEEPQSPFRPPCEDAAGKTYQAMVGEAAAPRVGAPPELRPIENEPPAARRSEAVICQENREYLESAFGVAAMGASASADSASGDGGGQQQAARECRTCGQVLPPGRRAPNLITHLISRSCFCERVLRGRRLFPLGTLASPSGIIAQSSDDAKVVWAASKVVWAECRERNFVPAASAHSSSSSSLSAPVWSCRHCRKPVRGGGHNTLFLHLARCVGIVPLVRDLGPCADAAAVADAEPAAASPP
jgi:hypothetical protein